MKSDILIIGGGASGLAAAVSIKAIRPAAEVVILEKTDIPGKKILATGNGRCNLSNKTLELADYAGSVRKLLPQIWAETPDSDDFFRSLGLLCRTDDAGRIYPYSLQAKAVRSTLCLTAKAQNVHIYTNQNIRLLERTRDRFCVFTDTAQFESDALLIAAGGGMTKENNIFRFLKQLGHAPTQLRPALTYWTSDTKRLHLLKGVRVKGTVSAWHKSCCCGSRGGEIQFTDKYISGICVMDLTALCEDEPDRLVIDLFPAYSEERLIEYLWESYALRINWSAQEWLSGFVHSQIAVELLKEFGAIGSMVADLPENMIGQLARIMKHWTFPVYARGGFDHAQVTSGGIPSEQILDTLESALCPGLFFSGELLDLHGVCGGYNLDFAWRSGQYAAQYILKRIR